MSRVVLLDGPMGTELIRTRVAPERVVHASLDAPALVSAVHQRYAALGAERLLTNTFALPFALGQGRIDQATARALLEAAVMLAGRFELPVAIDLGPPLTGDALRDRSVMELVLTWARPIIEDRRAHGLVFESAGANDLGWLVPSSGILRLAKVSHTVSFTADGMTLEATLGALPTADVIGLNCMGGPMPPQDTGPMFQGATAWAEAIAPLVERLRAVPLAPGQKRMLKPAVFGGVSPVAAASVLGRCGLDEIGYCCGATPEHFAALAAELRRAA